MRLGNKYGNLAKLGQEIRPLVLRATTVLPPFSTQSPNNKSLINPTGEPWEIHEIKFGCRRRTIGYSESDAGGGYERPHGSQVDVDISWLGHPVTDGYVPIWLLAPLTASEEHAAMQALTYVSANTGSGADRSQECFYRWKLDHPLYMPPGTGLNVSFRNNGLVNTTINQSIMLSGRVLPRSAKPRLAKVPFVSAWKSEFYEFLLGSGVETSDETTLFNTLDKPINVTRFCSRIAQRLQVKESGGPTQENYLDVYQSLLNPNKLFAASMWMTTGDLICRDSTMFNQLFGWRTKWDVPHVLPPATGYIIMLTKSAEPENGGYRAFATYTYEDVRAQCQVSVVGWREEEAA